jgi:hypothetical protein
VKFPHKSTPVLALQHKLTFANVIELEPRIRPLNVPFCEFTSGCFGGRTGYFIRCLQAVLLFADTTEPEGQFANRKGRICASGRPAGESLPGFLKPISQFFILRHDPYAASYRSA